MSSNFCSSCGNPLAENDTFCPNCGHCINNDHKPNNNFMVNRAGSVSEASTATVVKDRPDGLGDWLVIALVVWALYESLSGLFEFSYFYGGLLAALIFYKKDLFINALCHRNIFKPFMIHFTWGIVVFELGLYLFFDILDSKNYYDPFSSLFHHYASLFGAYLFINALYYVGYRVICQHYKNSEPQGQLVRAFVTLGLLLLYWS